MTLLLDGLVRAVELGLTRRRRGRLTAALAAIGLLYGYAGITFAAALLGDRERPTVVSAKSFTEQYISAQP